MIKWIKNDFRSVRGALSCLVNREIPLGIAILYYIVAGVLFAPIGGLLWIWYKIYYKITLWRLEKEFDRLVDK